MHFGSLPPNAAIRPWVQVGELVRDALSPARIPPIDPTEEVGAVGQPFGVSASGMPRMSEDELIAAKGGLCPCHPATEPLRTLAEWDEIERTGAA